MDVEALRTRREERRRAIRRRRMAAGLILLVAALAVAAIAAFAGGGGGGGSPHTSADAVGRARSGVVPGATTAAGAVGRAGRPGTRAVPILMYHVIAPAPAGAPFPGLYVPPSEFSEQMHALKADGWHAVTMDQLEAYWRDGVPLGPGKPIVLSFDNGYQSQYTQALPVLRSLGWVGVENIQLTGLPPPRAASEQTRSTACWPPAGSLTPRGSATRT